MFARNFGHPTAISFGMNLSKAYLCKGSILKSVTLVENRVSEAEKALKKVNSATEEFTSFYSLLIEKGIEKTEYGDVFDSLAQKFSKLYATTKSRCDELAHDKGELEAGFKICSTFERRTSSN